MYRKAEINFERIIEGCCEWDRNMQNALYQLFYSYGMSICIRYVESEPEAISVLNDGFLKVFRNIKRYKQDQPFKPWFRRIVVNTAIDYVKSQQRFKIEMSMEEAKNVPTTEDILSRINYKELMAMVQSLSAAYRTVFNMYVIDGFKHEEIADILGISVSTSKSNLTRARARLQDLLSNKLDDRYV